MERTLIPGENHLETLYPDVAAEWDYEENGSLEPSMVLPGSNRIVSWKCSNGQKEMMMENYI